MTYEKHQFHSAPVLIEDLAPVLRLSLRVKPAHRDTLARVLGLDLPVRVGARSAAAGTEALCLGPDEWLLTAPEGTDLTTPARAVHADAPHSLVDISDREITLRLTGPAVLDLLSACCPRNVAAMPVGAAARTVFDSATVILWRDGIDSFRMDVWRSFAPHVRSLLAQVQGEIAAGL
ncbi:sarcosine oxidase subunit gamma [Paracoccus sediminis]|uniref:Sarcosine oxidase subunit gamma n=1 Tax=Paracoccus sediminis TaxID=1214787 RepID=A0A238WLX2_9RHOB|nr:sarcosine oxidase subunit gamma family protein [Paracoccus sediminis]TBN50507.1 sarcosine oxidase subunit gamma [Paracoccus sediminis]SNR47224.1 sarcosine oxidase subunit gamma [Paracoccus sediminis]